jgi:hypothetical protein
VGEDLSAGFDGARVPASEEHVRWFVFEAVWPILDEDRTMSALVAEACAEVDALCRAQGGRIVGEIAWAVDGLRLIARATAAEVDGRVSSVPKGTVSERVDRIRSLAGRGWTDERIAAELGCSASAVTKVRARAEPRIPAGGTAFGHDVQGGEVA